MQAESRAPEPVSSRILTVGHSIYEMADFLALLAEAGVTAVADVRSSPYSKRMQHFAGPVLKEYLQTAGIRYVFLGNELGGRPADPKLYDAEGWADYERIAETHRFRVGLDRVVQGMARFSIALMCGEEDPLDCHRGLMISPALTRRGVEVAHLRKAGVIESMAHFEQRLAQETGLGGLFAEGLADAYRVLNRKKAFRWSEPE